MKIIVRGLFTFVTACLAVPAFAQTSAREYSLEIERQPLADALIEFSQQTGLQIGYFPENLSKNLFIGPLRGRYTADAAITQLLLPSGFSFERLNERTIAVTGPESTRPQRGSFLATEQKMDPPSSHSFVRVADLRWAEGPATEGNVQESGRAANARESDRKKSLGLEEVIVTAQKRRERLQDVPISISVLSGGDLDKSTVGDLTEVLSRVPGVAVAQNFLTGRSSVQVRGVVALAGNSTTAYYLDGLPLESRFGPDPNAYDLDRVEVLRGPQGTLYGASALNGVVRVVTKDANAGAFEFKARMSASTTQSGGENYRGDVAVNLPIVDGKLAARAVVGYQDWSGWIDRPHRKDSNDVERRNMRLKINASPTEQLSIDVSGWSFRDMYTSGPGGRHSGQNAIPFDEPALTDVDAYGLKIAYEFPSFLFTSMTSNVDFLQEIRPVLLQTLLLTGRSIFLHGQTTEEVFAQEVNLISTHRGFWRWSAGGLYRDSEIQTANGIPALFPGRNITRNTSTSYAAFGELTRFFFEGQVELTAGLRYFEDDTGIRGLSRFSGVPEQPVSRDEKFRATTGRLILTWHPSPAITVYASGGEGFRSGVHQNLEIAQLLSLIPATEPDKLKSYEIGAKGSLWGSLSFDAALYYLDWQNIQQETLVGVPIGNAIRFFATTINGESASGIGFDFAVTTRPVDGLELGVNFSWNDLTSDVDVFATGVRLLEEGDRFSLSPEYTAGASAAYIFPLGRNGFEGQFSASANYTSEQLSRRIFQGVRFMESGDTMLLARTSVSVRAPEHWTATVFIDNVNNERGTPVRNELGTPDRDVRVRPRTVGVQLEYRF